MEASPIISTSAPASAAPAANAAASAGELGRMSCPTTIVGAPVTAHERRTRAPAQLLVELVGDRATHVVRLEDGVRVGPVGGGPLGGRHAREPNDPPAGRAGQSGVTPRSAPGGGRGVRSRDRHPSAPPRAAPGSPRPSAGPPRGRRRRGRAGRPSRAGCVLGSGARRSTSQPRGAESRSAVRVAEVVGVRLGVRRERAHDGRLVGVHVGEGGDRGAVARSARTTPAVTHGADGTAGAAERRLRHAGRLPSGV